MLDTTTAAPTTTVLEPPFVFGLANNPMRDIEHGPRIAAKFGAPARDFDFNFAFDPQFRELGDSVRAAFKDRADMESIKRFSKARLVACDSAQSRGGMWGLTASTPSTGASEEEPFPCSHPRCRAACFSPWSPSP